MENTVNPEMLENGTVNISDDVVSIIASLAVNSIKGVVGMVSSISGGFAELLGKKNLAKGVKVTVSENKVTLDLAIIVEYGAKIPDVAWEIQEKVKNEVESMTGLTVAAVNVSVEGVNVTKETTPAKNVAEVVEKTEKTEKAEKAEKTENDVEENTEESIEENNDDSKMETENIVETTAEYSENNDEGAGE
ncbi:MAG: Asp23/Gls24 family envelope stress response protein [Oscillospiraceae bacterium]